MYKIPPRKILAHSTFYVNIIICENKGKVVPMHKSTTA